jgi:hypothetical protein
VTDYAWPTRIPPTSSSLAWLDNTAIFTSPLSGTTRTLARPGGRWRQTLTVQGLQDQPAIEAFVFRLNGAEHRALLPDFGYKRQGAGGGTPRVNGASQTGLSLVTDGWPASTLVLKAGDRIGSSGQMLVVTQDATTNGSGQVTLQLAHPIRVAPANDSLIEIDAPTARYILTNKAGFSSSAPRSVTVKTILLEFEEAIP